MAFEKKCLYLSPCKRNGFSNKVMRVLLVSTSDRNGGAAIACSRIFQALKKNGAEVKMLVRDKVSDEKDIFTVNKNVFVKFFNFLNFCLERLCILFKLGFKKKNLFQVSFDNFGALNLLDNPLVEEADVINFHWTSQGLLSLNQLEKLLKKNKHIVFTMHDMHYFTGICHYARKCNNFENGCGNCLFLKEGKKENDFSRRWFLRKMEIERRQKLIFVACSNWLRDTAKTSLMFEKNKVFSVPNPINTDVFRPYDKAKAREKFNLTKKYVILFGAANFTDKRKGLKYLLEALRLVHIKNTEFDEDIQLLVFGEGDPAMMNQFPYSYKTAGYIKDEKDLAMLYSAANVFVTPSLDDNLPNTVMEALSCGVPCAAFNTGGLPQLIDHNANGYLAELQNSKDLAEGIFKIITSDNYTTLCHNARSKVETNFSEPVIAMKYNEIYREAAI